MPHILTVCRGDWDSARVRDPSTTLKYQPESGVIEDGRVAVFNVNLVTRYLENVVEGEAMRFRFKAGLMVNMAVNDK